MIPARLFFSRPSLFGTLVISVMIVVFSLSSQTAVTAAEILIRPNAGSAARVAPIRVKRQNAPLAPGNDAAIE